MAAGQTPDRFGAGLTGQRKHLGQARMASIEATHRQRRTQRPPQPQ
jgi:hypothetical protein